MSLRDALGEPEGFNDQLSLLQIAGLPDVIKTTPAAEDEEEIMQALLIPTLQAAQNLDKMRATEGEKLAEDLLAKEKTSKHCWIRSRRARRRLRLTIPPSCGNASQN